MDRNRLQAKRIEDLLERLEDLEARSPGPHQAAIHAIAREAILDELGRLLGTGAPAVHRGATLTANAGG